MRRAARALNRLLRSATKSNVFVCGTRVISKPLTGYDIHRGCLALAERPPPRVIDDVLAAARTLVVLEDVANADNVGGIFRNAAAFGVDGVVLSRGCVDPLYRKAIRTSMAAVLHGPVRDVADGEWRRDPRGDSAQRLSARRADAGSVGGGPRRVRVRRSRLIAWRFSSAPRVQGLTLSQRDAADVRVRIPIRGEVDSLNVSVATGIALHRLAVPTSAVGEERPARRTLVSTDDRTMSGGTITRASSGAAQ